MSSQMESRKGESRGRRRSPKISPKALALCGVRRSSRPRYQCHGCGMLYDAAEAPAKKEEEEEEEDVDSRFVLDASLPTSSGFQPPVEGPKLPARNKLSFGQMSNSYGKGFAMLQKMGFTGGGLGKHRDGIANPIEVQKRQGRTGLQDDGEMVDQDLYGNEGRRSIEELLSIGEGKGKPGAKKPEISQGWKRDKVNRPKTVYKTAQEVSEQDGQAPSMRIVDMRGPEVKVASSFAELAASLSGDSVRSLKEPQALLYRLKATCQLITLIEE